MCREVAAADVALRTAFASYISSSVLLNRIVNDGNVDADAAAAASAAAFSAVAESASPAPAARAAAAVALGLPSSPPPAPAPAAMGRLELSAQLIACGRLKEAARLSLLRASRELESAAQAVSGYSGRTVVLSCVPTKALLDGAFLHELDDTGQFPPHAVAPPPPAPAAPTLGSDGAEGTGTGAGAEDGVSPGLHAQAAAAAAVGPLSAPCLTTCERSEMGESEGERARAREHLTRCSRFIFLPSVLTSPLAPSLPPFLPRASRVPR